MQGQGVGNRYGQDDEIDLVELARTLWAQRVLIGLVTAVVFLCAAAYAYLATPVYQVRASVLPPQISDIAGYNIGRSQVAGLRPYTVDDVYGIFVRSLQSEALRAEFFNTVYLPAVNGEEFLADFNKSISIKSIDKQRPKEKEPEHWQVTLEHGDPVEAAEWVNRFVAMAAEMAQNTMQKDIAGEISIHAQALERRIDALRQTAAQRRADRIALLEEALKVAESAGLEEARATLWQTFVGADPSTAGSAPLYLLGAQSIRAELAVLRKRQSDDPFIPELRSLQERLEFLKGVDVNPENVSVFTFDSPALVPERPVKPKKALILSLGLVLGGMLGVFLALVRNMISQRFANA